MESSDEEEVIKDLNDSIFNRFVLGDTAVESEEPSCPKVEMKQALAQQAVESPWYILLYLYKLYEHNL